MIVGAEAEKNPIHEDRDYLDERIQAIDEYCLEFHKQVQARELQDSRIISPTDSGDLLRHNHPKTTSILNGLTLQDTNKEKHQQEEDMENFKVHIEQQFLNLADKPKQLHELDPLKVSIAQIVSLPEATQVFPGERNKLSKLHELQTRHDTVNVQFNEFIAFSMKEAGDEGAAILRTFDNVPREKLAEQILADRPEQASNMYSADHMFELKTNEEEKLPENKQMARLMKSLKPEWYQLSAVKDTEIDPSEIINVDFDRDLGPMQRKLILPSNQRVLEREQRKISDKMTSFETLDEIYLMIISGLAPIKRIPYLENLAPKLAKYPKPVVNVSQD